VKETKGEITFLRRILAGPSDQSYGIHVAQLAGIPRPVIDRAREILFNLEKKELDGEGLPRISYRLPKKKDNHQLLLFEEDREAVLAREIRDEVASADFSAMTPLEALNFLSRLKDKLTAGQE